MMDYIQIVLILLLAVVLHEYAHGWTAFRCGDMTAKLSGRLSLNPLRHIDPIGTIVLPAILLAMRALGYPVFIFGWARPVPVNFAALKNPKRDMILVALAGPAINIFLAWVASLFLNAHLSMGGYKLVTTAIFINLLLAVFNLIPIPPLDGSRVVMGVLPRPYDRMYSRLEPYGLLIIVLLLYLGILDLFVWPTINSLGQLLGVDFG